MLITKNDLTAKAKELICQDIIDKRLKVSEAERHLPVSRQSIHNWLADYKKQRENIEIIQNSGEFDSVAGLGNFLEFEGVVDSSGDPTRVRGTVEHLIGQFRPILGEPVSGSYADM